MMVRKLRNAGKMEACGWHTQIGVPNKTPCERWFPLFLLLKVLSILVPELAREGKSTFWIS